jgi:hypothetical protein
MSDTAPSFEEFQQRVKGTNICEQTLLATDYLNHINEPIMLLEMVADVPELLEELAEWQPKTYAEHFRDSSFTDKDLAIEAYEWSPDRYRLRFEQTINSANQCIATAIDALGKLIEQERLDDVRILCTEVSTLLGDLVDRAGSIIHGNEDRSAQTQIDQIMDEAG